MANEEQLAVLRQGSDAWNAWRGQNLEVMVDLSSANLARADLSKAKLRRANLTDATLTETSLIETNLFGANLLRADLTRANLSGADLFNAHLSGANLTEANLARADASKANFFGANLFRADLSKADLVRAYLSRAHVLGANLTEANLTRADLSGATLVVSNLTGADLSGCRVYGISAWDLKLNWAEQKDLIITPLGRPEITVDNLEVAQFIYLLLKNERIRHVIETITSKVVLILGRFTPERKVVLDALREELRQLDYTPVLFDFDKPASKDLTGTVQTLANMARFVIADLTDPSSVSHELAMVVPNTPVPVQPVLLEGQREYAMSVDLKRRYHWVLEPYCYASAERLIADLSGRMIVPAEAKARELRGVSPPTG
jgi:uncharacterized protein YjbI with pentapeptide repeats